MTPDQQRILDDLLDVDYGLQEREIEFLDSMNGKRERTWSIAQVRWINDIWDRIFGT